MQTTLNAERIMQDKHAVALRVAARTAEHQAKMSALVRLATLDTLPPADYRCIPAGLLAPGSGERSLAPADDGSDAETHAAIVHPPRASLQPIPLPPLQLTQQQLDRIQRNKTKALTRKAAKVARTALAAAAEATAVAEAATRQRSTSPNRVTQPIPAGPKDSSPVTGPDGAGRATIDRAWASRRRTRTTDPSTDLLHRGPDCLTWTNDDSVSKLDTSHRKNQWWAIDTVNANAWPSAADYLATTAADFVVFQEARLTAGDSAKAAEQTARGNKWHLAVNPCKTTAAGGKSAGTAIAARSHIGMASIPSVECTHHLHPQGRFSCKKVNAILKGGYHLGSIYLTDTVGALAKCNLDQLDSVAFTLDGLKGPFVIGGDWNCTPAELKATGWLKRVNGVIVAPRRTHLQRQHVRLLRGAPVHSPSCAQRA